MSCQLCTQGFTFDLVWRGHWTVEEIGKCKCYGGTSEPRAEIVQLARQSGRHVNIILIETLVRNVECQLKEGRQFSEREVNNVLAAYLPELPLGEPEKPAAGGVDVDPYDFGDGFEREDESIPF